MSGPLWDELADLALDRLRNAGVEYADIRLLESTTRTINGEDRRIAQIRDTSDRGFGIRVLHRGAWGFAASSILSLEEVPRVADLAVEIAKGSASLAIEKIRLAPEPVHRDRIETPCRVDPFAVPLEEQTALLLNTMDSIQRQAGVVRSHASLWAQRDRNSSHPPKARIWSLPCWRCRAIVPPRRSMTDGLRPAPLTLRIYVWDTN